MRTQRVVEASWPTQRHTLVTVVEIAEAGQGDNLGVTNYADLPWAARGCGPSEAEVGAIIMVVSHVVPEQAMQVAIVEDDYVVGARGGRCRSSAPRRRTAMCFLGPYGSASCRGTSPSRQREQSK